MPLFFLRTTGLLALVLILQFIPSKPACSQVADSVRLEPIEVEASRLPIEWIRQPINITMIDSAAMRVSGHQNLGEMLQFHSTVFIRQYGSGGLSSVSSRGFGARHTQLVWNGFVMNHPMLGQLDYNLFPGSMVGNVRVASGNSSASYGSGAVGGSILMDSPKNVNQSSIQFHQGRWGRFGTAISTGLKKGNSRVGVSLYGAQATNNFPYFDSIRQRERNRRNNQFQQQHAQITAGHSSHNFNYDTALWIGSSTHFVPGPVTTSNPQARQDDQTLHWSHQAGYETSFGFFQIDALYSSYNLDYFDPQNRIESLSSSKRRDIRFTYREDLTDWFQLASGLETGFHTIDTNNYDSKKHRNITSVWTQGDVRPLPFLSVFPSFRLDRYSDFGNAFTTTIGVNIQTPLNWLSFRMQGATNYSAPTLNDLFWSPGGNPDLRAEKSQSLEAGISLFYSQQPFSLRFATTAYRIWFDDGIQWLPGSSGIWSPVNINKIDSRGIETELNLRYRIWDIEVRANSAIAITEATQPLDVTQSETQQTFQLPYVPKWTLKATGEIRYKPIFSSISWESASSRFTTADHSSPIDPLDGFSVMNLQIGAQIAFGHIHGHFSYTLHNLTNRDYQVVAWYPMPPRYHSLQVSFTINHKK